MNNLSQQPSSGATLEGPIETKGPDMNNANAALVTILALVLGLGTSAGLWLYLEDRAEQQTAGVQNATETLPQPRTAQSDPANDWTPPDDMDPGAALKTKVLMREAEEEANARFGDDGTYRTKAVARLRDYVERAEKAYRSEEWHTPQELTYASRFDDRVAGVWDEFTSAAVAAAEERRAEHVKDFRTVPDLPAFRHDRLFLAAKDCDYTLAGYSRFNVLDQLVHAALDSDEPKSWARFQGRAIGKLIADDYAQGFGNLKRIMDGKE